MQKGFEKSGVGEGLIPNMLYGIIKFGCKKRQIQKKNVSLPFLSPKSYTIILISKTHKKGPETRPYFKLSPLKKSKEIFCTH